MRLTTKGRYAVTAMLDLSLNYGNGPITLSGISGRQGISLSYLEQLFSRLRKQGLVVSSRGPGGGYSLSRPADKISVGDVIYAVDENVDSTKCKGQRNCKGDDVCISHELWQSLSTQISKFLAGITLAEVVKNHQSNKQDLNVINFENG